MIPPRVGERRCGPASEGRCGDGVTTRAASRRVFLRRLLVGAGGVAAGGALWSWSDDAVAAPSKAQDVRIFNLVLLLEYTEEAFYSEALQRGALRGELRDYAVVVREQERDHRLLLERVLAAKAVGRPRFEFGTRTGSAKSFTTAAIKLEDLAVAAYNGQAANLTRGALAAAATIVSVEARHAAWIRAIAGQVAAPDAVDKPITAAQAALGLRQIGLRS
jgi:ferritin-like protein